MNTYSQNLQRRRAGLEITLIGMPIEGVRTPATIARKKRSQAARARRKEMLQSVKRNSQ